MKRNGIWIGLLMFFGILCSPAMAWEFSGAKTIYLHDKSGQKLEAGTVEFTPHGEQIGFDIHWNHAKMKDYFLSMREFKCFEGQGEVQCQVPYPYKNPKTITASNFAWLENNMLFLYKAPVSAAPWRKERAGSAISALNKLQ